MTMKRGLKAICSLLLALGMLFSFGYSTVSATVSLLARADGAEQADVISYVALGASNTNGYGHQGYLPEGVDSTNKNQLNVFGYKKTPQTAYPSLIREALKEANPDKTVELHQLAISSMRAEELRVLLDDSYYGDAYTEWRFLGDDSQKWFDIAEPGGIEALRETYREAITEADYITVDVGTNNFGVFTLNRIMYGMFDADFSKVFEGEELAKFQATYDKILSAVLGIIGEDSLPPEMTAMLTTVVETLTYAFTGFCVSFDASMEKIYQLNPDAKVGVIAIQNLMSGIKAEFPGFNGEIPLGEIYGYVVDLANLYASAFSPYSARYNYVALGEVKTFYDELREMEVNYQSVSADANLIDCFNIYDDDLYISEVVDRSLDGIVLDTLASVSGSLPGEYAALFADVETYLDFIEVMSGLQRDDEGAFAGFWTLYDVCVNHRDYPYIAHTVVAEAMQGLVSDTIDLGAVMGDMDAAANTMFAWLTQLIMDNWEATVSATSDEISSFTPEFSQFVAEIDETPYTAAQIKEAYSSAATMAIRTTIGNSFFAHPSIEGHAQIADAVIYAWENNVMGEDVAAREVGLVINKLCLLLQAQGPAILEKLYEFAESNGSLELVTALVAKISSIGEAIRVNYPIIKAEIEGAYAEVEEYLSGYGIELDELLDATVGSIKEFFDTVLSATQILCGAAEVLFTSTDPEEIERAALQIKTVIKNLMAYLGSESFDAFKAEFTGLVSQLKESIFAEIDAVKELDSKKELKDYVDGRLEELRADAEAFLTQLFPDNAQNIRDMVTDVKAKLLELTNTVFEAFDNALTGDYVADSDSYYVSIGDSTVTGMGLAGYGNYGYGVKVRGSFAYELAQLLGLDVETQFIQLGQGGMRADDVLNILDEDFEVDGYGSMIENEMGMYGEGVGYGAGLENYRKTFTEEIAKADLISVGIGNNNFTTLLTTQIVRVISGQEPFTLNWENYVKAEDRVLIDEAFDFIYTYLTQSGILDSLGELEEIISGFLGNGNQTDIDMPMLARVVAETLLYGYVSFANNYTEVLDIIHRLNPTAEVLVIGFSNTLRGLTVDLDGTVLPVGNLLQIGVDFINAHFMAYALVTPNTTFVDVDGTSTFIDEDIAAGEYENVDFMTYLTAMFSNNGEAIHPGAEGHRFMAQQAFRALTAHEEEHVCENSCPECGKCLDAECEEEACADKCQGHQGEDDPGEGGSGKGDDGDNGGLSGGAIAGVVSGSVIGVGGIAAIAWFLLRKKR